RRGDRHAHRRHPVRRADRTRLESGCALAARPGAPPLHRAGADAEDPGTHRAHDDHRETAAELTPGWHHPGAPFAFFADQMLCLETFMTRQIQDAYIVAALRTPVGKAPRGVF